MIFNFKVPKAVATSAFILSFDALQASLPLPFFLDWMQKANKDHLECHFAIEKCIPKLKA